MLTPTRFFFFTLYSSQESWAPANIRHHFHVRYDRELRLYNNSVLSAAEMLQWSSSDSVKSTLTHVVKTPLLRFAQQFVHKRSRPTSRPTTLLKRQQQKRDILVATFLYWRCESSGLKSASSFVLNEGQHMNHTHRFMCSRFIHLIT